MRILPLFAVLSVVLSSPFHPDRLARKNKLDLLLSTVVGTPQEDLNHVLSIFKALDLNEGDKEGLTDLRLLKTAKDPEVLRLLLQRLDASVTEAALAPALVAAIRQQFAATRGDIPPGSSTHQIIELYLQALSTMQNGTHLNSLQSLMHYMITQGQTKLLETFLASGVEMPRPIPVGLSEIKQKLMPMIEILLHNGLRLELQVYQVIRLLKNPELTVEGFQMLLDNMLPWKMTDRNSNWLIEALRAGRLDICYFLYQKGMRLPKSFAKGTSSSKLAHGFQKTPTQLAWYIISNEGVGRLFDKYHTLLQGIIEPGSAISDFPKETLGEMMDWILSLEAKEIEEGLYE